MRRELQHRQTVRAGALTSTPPHSTFLLFGPPRMSIISGRVELTGPAVLLTELSGVISAIESIAG